MNLFASRKMSVCSFLGAFVVSLVLVTPNKLLGQSQFSESEIEIVGNWLNQSIQSLDEETLAISLLLAQAHDFGIPSSNFLSKAQKLNLSNTSLLVSLIVHCDSDPALSDCNTSDYLEKLKLFDSENAIPYVLSALYLDSQEDTSAALLELELASKKLIVDNYFIQRAEFLSDALRTMGYNEEKIYAHAFQYSGIDFLTIYQKLTVACEKYVEASNAWKRACIGIGETMEDYGRTFISVRTGIALQRSMYAFDSSDQHLLEAVQRRSAFTHRWRVLRAEHLEQLLSLSGDQYYIDHFEKDEIYAVNRAFQRLSGVPDPDPFLRRNPQFIQSTPD